MGTPRSYGWKHAEGCPAREEDDVEKYKGNGFPIEDAVDEAYSRRAQFDRYHAMQGFLMDVANFRADQVNPELQEEARRILSGESAPVGVVLKAQVEARRLERWALAYRILEGQAQKYPVAGNEDLALGLILEMLLAGERAEWVQRLKG